MAQQCEGGSLLDVGGESTYLGMYGMGIAKAKSGRGWHQTWCVPACLVDECSHDNVSFCHSCDSLSWTGFCLNERELRTGSGLDGKGCAQGHVHDDWCGTCYGTGVQLGNQRREHDDRSEVFLTTNEQGDHDHYFALGIGINILIYAWCMMCDRRRDFFSGGQEEETVWKINVLGW